MHHNNSDGIKWRITVNTIDKHFVPAEEYVKVKHLFTFYLAMSTAALTAALSFFGIMADCC